LRALQQQVKKLSKKVEREKILLASLPELSLQILEHAREHGRTTIGDMVRLTGVSRNTLKEHFRQLLEKQHLAMHGRGRGSWYSLL
jgi:predicted HTH transcriptional regulator